MTKRGMGSNCFDNEQLRKYYDDVQQCFDCGRYNATDFHHNVPRANNHAGSLLNAVPLCRDCHSDHGRITRTDHQQLLFERVITYLDSHGYKLNELDLDFIRENEDKFFAILVGYLNKKP